MKLGYARVSTEDQSLDLQIAASERAGCQHLFFDHGISGARFSRPGLESALLAVGPGDSAVVWRLDRLGRSLRKLVELVDELGRRGVEFVSLQGHLEEMYGTEVSPTLISAVTDAVSEEVKLWQGPPLDALYPIIYLDCIHVKVRDSGGLCVPRRCTWPLA